MRRFIRIATGTASAALLAFGGNVRADVVDTRELMETIPVSANEPLVVIVKNIIGPIHVTGHDANRVEMHATDHARELEPCQGRQHKHRDHPHRRQAWYKSAALMRH